MKTLHRRTEEIALALVALLILAVMPLSLDPFRLNLLGKYMAFAFVAIGIVLTWGYCGVLSLGQGIFFGLGGYMMAMFLKLEASAPELPDFMVWSSVDNLPVWWLPFHSLGWTLLLIVALPGAAAYLFSLAIFRKRVGGVYFAIVTLALAMTLTVLIIGQQGDTGGANGITDFRTLLGWDIVGDDGKQVLYLVEAAILSSIGGAFFTLQVGLISPGAIGVVASIEMVIYAAVGGRLSIPGAVVGALLIGFLKSYLSETFPEIWLYFLGAIFIVVVVAMPNGLAGVVSQLQARRNVRSAR